MLTSTTIASEGAPGSTDVRMAACMGVHGRPIVPAWLALACWAAAAAGGGRGAASETHCALSDLLCALCRYEEMYRRSIEDPNGFWREVAMNNFYWETPIPEQHHLHNFDVKKARAGPAQPRARRPSLGTAANAALSPPGCRRLPTAGPSSDPGCRAGSLPSGSRAAAPTSPTTAWTAT